MDCASDLLRMILPEKAGCEDVHTAAHSHEKTGEYHHQRGRASYGSKCRRARKSADDGNIRHVEQDLKKVGQYEWNTEEQYSTP